MPSQLFPPAALSKSSIVTITVTLDIDGYDALSSEAMFSPTAGLSAVWKALALAIRRVRVYFEAHCSYLDGSVRRVWLDEQSDDWPDLTDAIPVRLVAGNCSRAVGRLECGL